MFIEETEKGSPNGVATLNSNRQLTASQLPDITDAVGDAVTRYPGFANGKVLAVNGGVIAWQTPGSFQEVLAMITTFTPVSGDGKITFTFSAVTGAETYTIEASASGLWNDIISVTGSAPTEITGLTNGQEYTLRARANATGKISGAWKVNDNRIAPNGAPDPQLGTSMLSKTATGNGFISLSWTAVSGATTYRYQSATNNLFTTGMVEATQAGTIASPTSSNGVQRYYRVRGEAVGKTPGEWSNIVTGTPVEKVNLVYKIDSQTQGNYPRPNGLGGTVYGFPNCWPDQLATDLLLDTTRVYTHTNLAIAGDSINTTFGTLSAWQKAEMVAAYDATADRNIMFIHGPLNNIQLGENAATTFDWCRQLHEYAQGLGYETIASTLTASRFDPAPGQFDYGSYDTAALWATIQDYNNNYVLDGGWDSVFNAKACIDTQQHPALAGYAAPRNPLYFRIGDWIHYFDNGYRAFKDLAKDALAKTLANTPGVAVYNGDPVILSMETLDSTHVRLTFNVAMNATTAGWSFENGSALTLSSVSGSGTTAVTFTVSPMAFGDAITMSYSAGLGNTVTSSGSRELWDFTDIPVKNSLVTNSKVTVTFPDSYPDNLTGDNSDTYQVSADWKTSSTDGGFNHSRISNLYIPAGVTGSIYMGSDTVNAFIGFSKTLTRGGYTAGMRPAMFIDVFLDFIVTTLADAIVAVVTPFTSPSIFRITRTAGVSITAQQSDNGGSTWTTIYTFDVTGHTDFLTDALYISIDLVGGSSNILTNPQAEGVALI